MNKTNFKIDFLLFITLCLLQFQRATGLFLHILLGLALTLAVLIHLILHRKWILAALKNCVPSSNQRVRRLRILNVFLAVCFSFTIVSGIFNAISLTSAVASSTPEARLEGVERQPGGGPFHSRNAIDASRERARRDFHWHILHQLFAGLTFLGVLVHLGLHWSWVKTTTRQFFPPSVPSPKQSVE